MIKGNRVNCNFEEKEIYFAEKQSYFDLLDRQLAAVGVGGFGIGLGVGGMACCAMRCLFEDFSS